jgi:hypothetical protein
MKNKLEQKLDVEFGRMKKHVYVYHIPVQFISTIKSVTIATTAQSRDWCELRELVHHSIYGGYDMATRLLITLKEEGLNGIAICDKRDQFNRQRGRIIAKGRLLKHLKEIVK